MIIQKYNSEEEWLADRKRRITGSKLHDIAGKTAGRKIGFYQLIADSIAVDADGEDPRERGHRLEVEAIEFFEPLTEHKFITDLCMWVRSDDERIAYSPDGYTKNHKVAVEVKCLSSARHLQAVLEDKIPNEYSAQVIQAFIVNDKLDLLYFILYDPRILARPLHVIECKRIDLTSEIEYYREFETRTLKQIDTYLEELAF